MERWRLQRERWRWPILLALLLIHSSVHLER